MSEYQCYFFASDEVGKLDLLNDICQRKIKIKWALYI